MFGLQQVAQCKCDGSDPSLHGALVAANYEMEIIEDSCRARCSVPSADSDRSGERPRCHAVPNQRSCYNSSRQGDVRPHANRFEEVRRYSLTTRTTDSDAYRSATVRRMMLPPSPARATGGKDRRERVTYQRNASCVLPTGQVQRPLCRHYKGTCSYCCTLPKTCCSTCPGMSGFRRLLAHQLGITAQVHEVPAPGSDWCHYIAQERCRRHAYHAEAMPRPDHARSR